MFKKINALDSKAHYLIITFILLFILFLSNSKAQTVNWSHNWGFSNEYIFAFSVGTDYMNNIYLCGGSVDPYGNISTALKYDQDGDLQWSKTYHSDYNGRFNSISVSPYGDDGVLISVTGYDATDPYYGCRTIGYDGSGNIRFNNLYYGPGYIYDFQTRGSQVVTMDEWGTTYVCGASPRAINEQFPRYIYFLVAYDIDGNQLFARTWDGGYDDHARGIAVSGGNIYITGVSKTEYDTWQVVTLAYDLDGDLLWESEPYAIADYLQDQNAFDVATHIIQADYTRGVYTCVKAANGNFATIKYDVSDGSIAWARADYAGSPNSLCLFPKHIGNTWAHTNDVIVTGHSNSGNGDCQTFIYNDNGTQLWRSTNNGGNYENLGIDVCTDASENVYVTGQIYTTLTNVDLIVIKYDNELNEIWNTPYDFEGSYDAGFGITTDLEGNIDIVGTCGHSTYDESDFWTLQIQSGSLNKPIKKFDNSLLPDKFTLNQNFPNPFNPQTKINYGIPKDGYVYIKIYNILGKEITTLENGFKQAGYYTINFDGKNLPSGVYFYKMISGGFCDVKRMVLLK
jgi:hypothetical protein